MSQTKQQRAGRMWAGAKRFLKSSMPGLFAGFRRRWGDSEAPARIAAHLRKVSPEPVVLEGPFKGMRYLEESAGSALIPKLLGTYELELHGVIERVKSDGYQTLIDIGCAEGYYAVGLARNCPAMQVVACDIDVRAQGLCRQLAEVNGVAARVEITGGCTTDSFAGMIRGKTAIVCDCEGAEDQLLDPVKAPALADCDILVELHDCFCPGLSERLLPRFESTHAITRIAVVPRPPGMSPSLGGLSLRDQQAAVDEHRPAGMSWAWMTRRESPPA